MSICTGQRREKVNTAQSSDLKEKLAKMLEERNASTKSKAANSTPLSAYVIIYSKASSECYVDYMEGAKLLWDWLSPIEVPEEEVDNSKMKLYNLINTYEVQKLAYHVVPNKNDLQAMWKFELAFLFTAYDLILGQ